jgi:iron-sulfur cluster assembly accessory protein
MITLTNKAVNQVQKVISEQTKGFAGLRVAVVGGGCSGFQYTMNLEPQSREGDDVVEIDGFKVFVDPQSMLYLDGTEIDYVETTQAAGFQFKNPNVTGSCGCGESFHV